MNILVAREDNKNAENVKEFLQSYQSPEVAKAAETIFNGGAVPWLVILTHAALDDLFFWRGDGNPLKSKLPMTESAAFPASPAM